MPSEVATAEPVDKLVHAGNAALRDGRPSDAITAFREAARETEVTPADVCLRLAQAYEAIGDPESAYPWLKRLVDAPPSFTSWTSAAALLGRIRQGNELPAKRNARIGLASSSTTGLFAAMLSLAAFRRGIAIDVHEGTYGQYRQEILAEHSDLYEFDPDVILIDPHEGDLSFGSLTDSPDPAVTAEVTRWTQLWDSAAARSHALIVQHNFVSSPYPSTGHLSARLAGSRHRLIQELNARLGDAATDRVRIVDCDRIASAFGKNEWFNERYWHVSKQAVSPAALPTLARHTAAVIAASLGLSSKCLVLDLDNTLWGGVIGEDGLAGIRLGGTPEGEAYLAVQSFVKDLSRRGVILAVSTKNDERDASRPFEEHPDMLLAKDDFAMFLANWDDKATNLRRIADGLDLGLDALVLLDDNPAEREAIRQLVPDVEVITLPADPSLYVRAISESLLFEPDRITSEDMARTEQYRARAQAAELRSGAESVADFLESLEMTATLAPFDELHFPRIVQLIGKTNQFNLTTRRHDAGRVAGFMEDDAWVTRYVKLRDRFGDLGLIGIAIARIDGEVLDIDSLLISCRAIGRTVENELMEDLHAEALRQGCTIIRGRYIPSGRNELVRDLFARLGFVEVGRDEDAQIWEHPVYSDRQPFRSGHISINS